MKSLFSFVLTTLILLISTCFADVNSTREVLRHHSANNSAVLDTYNETVNSWSEYANRSGKQWKLEMLLKAVEYAAEKHEGQTRKDAEKTPYIIHPIGVAKLLWEVGNIRNVNVLTAALLHDTLEDTDATEQEIEVLFGSRVLYTVKEVTNDPSLSSQENKERQIEHAPTMSLDGQLVKLADRLYNVRDLNPPPPSWSDEKVNEYYGWGEKLLEVLRGTNEGVELALQKLINSHRNKNAEESQSVTPTLTKQQLIDGYDKGLATGATHMLKVWDKFDFEDSYEFIVYCYPDNDVNDLVNYYTAPGYYRVSAVYAMHLGIEEQINEGYHPWHTEYPDN